MLKLHARPCGAGPIRRVGAIFAVVFATAMGFASSKAEAVPFNVKIDYTITVDALLTGGDLSRLPLDVSGITTGTRLSGSFLISSVDRASFIGGRFTVLDAVFNLPNYEALSFAPRSGQPKTVDLEVLSQTSISPINSTTINVSPTASDAFAVRADGQEYTQEDYGLSANAVPVSPATYDPDVLDLDLLETVFIGPSFSWRYAGFDVSPGKGPQGFADTMFAEYEIQGSIAAQDYSLSIVPVPLPAPALALLTGLIGLGAAARVRRRA